MFDVAVALDDGAWTLTQSRRARDHALRLRAELRDLLLTYRGHQLPPISGGSRERPLPAGESVGDHLRARLRLLVTPNETPALYAGYSAGTTVCDTCGQKIVRGAQEYEIAFSALTFVLDRDCFAMWRDEMVAAGPRSSAEKGRRGLT